MKFYRNISKLHKTQIHVGPYMHPKSQILFGVWCAWLSNSLSFFQTGEKTQNIHWFPVNETIPCTHNSRASAFDGIALFFVLRITLVSNH